MVDPLLEKTNNPFHSISHGSEEEVLRNAQINEYLKRERMKQLCERHMLCIGNCGVEETKANKTFFLESKSKSPFPPLFSFSSSSLPFAT